MEHRRAEEMTNQLRKAFPIWTKIRKDPNAIGSQFINVFGLRLAEVEELLDYALQQLYIDTADIKQTDVIYKAVIPGNLHSDSTYRLTSDSHILEEKQSKEKFLLSPTFSKENKGVQYNTDCYIDFENKNVYVHESFNKENKYPNGHITLKIYSESGEEIHREDLELHIHHVWNIFDEFGLLLDLPRLEGEKNILYKERILDVFRRPAGSHEDGLINGISRELGLIHEVKWDDGSEDLLLDRVRVDISRITVDDKPFNSAHVTKDRGGRILLKGFPEYEGIPRKVRYIAGVNLYELHDKTNTKFQNELRHIDGTATPLLQYYVGQIKDRVPMEWGRWKWNQGFWDVTNHEMSGYGYIPNLYDASFSKWGGYKVKEE